MISERHVLNAHFHTRIALSSVRTWKYYGTVLLRTQYSTSTQISDHLAGSASCENEANVLHYVCSNVAVANGNLLTLSIP